MVYDKVKAKILTTKLLFVEIWFVSSKTKHNDCTWINVFVRKVKKLKYGWTDFLKVWSFSWSGLNLPLVLNDTAHNSAEKTNKQTNKQTNKHTHTHTHTHTYTHTKHRCDAPDSAYRCE